MRNIRMYSTWWKESIRITTGVIQSFVMSGLLFLLSTEYKVKKEPPASNQNNTTDTTSETGYVHPSRAHETCHSTRTHNSDSEPTSFCSFSLMLRA